MKIFLLHKNIILRVILILVVILGSVAYTSYNNGGIVISVFSTGRELPIYSVETDDKKIAISFDAAWGDQYTEEILDILDKYDVKATFFLVGFWVDKYPDMVKKINARGHEIGNHSTNHPYMSKLSKEKIINELKNTEDKIKELTGKRTILFRPPFGDYNNLLIKTCREQNYYPIQWDVDSLDWKELGVQPVVDRVTRNVRKGSIVLFHNNAKYISQYLPIVLEKLKSDGYEIVPVSELIYKDGYYIDNTGRQKLK